MKKVILIGLLVVLNVHAAYSQASYRIFPSTITQTEPVIAVHPSNPLIMFASAVTINATGGFSSEGVYVTTNGGQNWFGSDTCKGQDINVHGRDPWVAISPSGRLILTRQSPTFSGVFSHYSDDLGVSWSNAYTITNQSTDDKGTSAIDNMPNSPFYGRMYSSWVANIQAFPPAQVSYSTNAGTSWSSPTTLNQTASSPCKGGYVRTGADGKVYVVWAGFTTSPVVEDFVGLAVSTNGGVTWQVSQNIFDVNGIFGTLASKQGIRVNGLPHLDIDKTNGSRKGWVYVVTTEKNLTPAGSDPDIVLRRSTDGGTTWSGAIRVNQDVTNNGKIQWFPAIHIDAQGGVNILFYDDRNTAPDSAEVMLARSTDGGFTWIERVISDHRFKPKPIVGGPSNYQGDHISITSAGGKLFPFWMDDYSGIYQIWTNPIDVGSLGVESGRNEIPPAFALDQNHPNPFNPSTTLSFVISRSSFVELRLYDVLGREVTTLVNEMKSPGRYSVEWNADGVSSGVYFYTLIAGSFSDIKKMVLIR